MASPIRVRGQYWVLATVGVCALFGGEFASAQLAFVPRHVTVIGGFYGGADTARSAELRGLGQLYQGQGQFLTGAGNYLQGLGQYQKDYQVAYAMSCETYQKRVAWQREWKQLREADEQVRLTAARQKNEGLKRDRLRDHASQQSVASGDSLNYLWDQLGSRVAAIPFQNLSLSDLELKSVRLQFANGFTLEKLQRAFTPDVRVNWPAALRRSEFDDNRSGIEKSLAKSQYAAAIQQCQSLEKVAREKSAQNGLEAWNTSREFCVALRQTLELINSNNLSQVHALLSYQPQDTGDLIRHMRTYGLRFAPTTDIAGTAYRMLHGTLAAAHQNPSLATLTLPLPGTMSATSLQSVPARSPSARLAWTAFSSVDVLAGRADAQAAAVPAVRAANVDQAATNRHADAGRKWLPAPVLRSTEEDNAPRGNE